MQRPVNRRTLSPLAMRWKHPGHWAIDVRDVVVAALLFGALGSVSTARGAELVPMIAPEVRTLAEAGRVRTLVELRVEGEIGSDARAQAITRTQDSLLSRLPAGHATLVRRFAAVPLVALEIDATGLHALERMGDIVAAVKPDQPRRTQ